MKQEEIKRGPIDGLEIYARKIENNGEFSSDAKFVTEDYKGEGKVVSSVPTGEKTGGIKGIFFEVAGNMQNDGVLQTDKDAIVGIKVKGNYSSKKGKIIQGNSNVFGWHTTWWGMLTLAIISGLVIAGLVYFFGWNK